MEPIPSLKILIEQALVKRSIKVRWALPTRVMFLHGSRFSCLELDLERFAMLEGTISDT
jgi:hypothetical protein